MGKDERIKEGKRRQTYGKHRHPDVGAWGTENTRGCQSVTGVEKYPLSGKPKKWMKRGENGPSTLQKEGKEPPLGTTLGLRDP